MLTLLLLSYLGLLPRPAQRLVDELQPVARRWAWAIVLLWAIALVGQALDVLGWLLL